MRDRLDLGCGTAKPDGYVGLDAVDNPSVDVVHDLRDTPLPFSDDRFVHVRAHNVLEHLPHDAFVDLLQEVGRITRPGGTLTVTGPHHLSHNAPAGDHFRGFSLTSFDAFTPDHTYPTPLPDLFRVREVSYTWNWNAERDPLLRVLRWWKGGAWMVRHVPNVVDEITFELEVL